MGPHLGPPREPPKSILGKKPLSTIAKHIVISYGYILKRGPRRGRVGDPSGAKSRLPLFVISVIFCDFADFM